LSLAASPEGYDDGKQHWLYAASEPNLNRDAFTIAGGEVTVTVPGDDDEPEDKDSIVVGTKSPQARQSIQVQSKLVQIGATMGFKIWIPRDDRGRVGELVPEENVLLFSKTFP